MNTKNNNIPDALAVSGADRVRFEVGDTLAEVQAAGLGELADLAEEGRCLVDDLTDAVHSSDPVPHHELRDVTAVLSQITDTLARATRGYAGTWKTDMAYRNLVDDLSEHGWVLLPDRELDGVLPPIPMAEWTGRRGYRVGWHRGCQMITLWLTGPWSLAYGMDCGYGRLCSAQDVAAVITSEPVLRDVLAQSPGRIVPCELTYAQVVEHMRAAGWGGPVEEHPCDGRGIRRLNGLGTSAAWTSPRHPEVRVWAWGVGDEPARVVSGAGVVESAAALRRVTDHH